MRTNSTRHKHVSIAINSVEDCIIFQFITTRKYYNVGLLYSAGGLVAICDGIDVDLLYSAGGLVGIGDGIDVDLLYIQLVGLLKLVVG